LDTVFHQRRRRKVQEIEGDDPVGFAVNCRRENVAAVWIRKRESGDKPLIAAYQAVADMGIHQVTDSFDLPLRYVGMGFQDATHPLLVNRLRPLGVEHVGQRQVHEKTAQRRRKEYAGVVKDGQAAHA
jgi:hypothetical protein